MYLQYKVTTEVGHRDKIQTGPLQNFELLVISDQTIYWDSVGNRGERKPVKGLMQHDQIHWTSAVPNLFWAARNISVLIM